MMTEGRSIAIVSLRMGWSRSDCRTEAFPVSTRTTARLNDTTDSGSYPALRTRVFTTHLLDRAEAREARNGAARERGTVRGGQWGRRREASDRQGDACISPQRRSRHTGWGPARARATLVSRAGPPLHSSQLRASRDTA